MHYKNAKECLPEALLKEVQRYAGGMMLYIPTDGEKAAWGMLSGSREQLDTRNQAITEAYRRGESIQKLAAAYYLSEDSVRKIIYSQKN